LQGADGIRLLLQELNADGSTNKMLMLSLEALQMEAGIQNSILEETRPLQYIEWGWIPSIRDFLHHLDAKITNVDIALKTFRGNDQLIMDSIPTLNLSRKEQILINRCRLLLQVECLSDITDSTGKYILEQWLNNSTPKPSRSLKRWPRQGDPGKEAWQIWKKFLTAAFNNTSGKLRNPLGPWTHQNNNRRHSTYWSQKLNVLLISHGKHWQQFQKIQSGRRQNFFSNEPCKTSTLPDDATPVNILHHNNKHYVTGQLPELQETPKSTTTTFYEKLMQQRNNTMFHSVDMIADEKYLHHLFQRHALIDTATDGGHDPYTGILTYGWVIAVNECIIARGRGPAEAHPEMAESFRAEAYGLASATAVLWLMIQHFQILEEDHRWFFHINSKTLISRMESYETELQTPKWAHKPDIDITNTVHRNLKGMKAQFVHIKGHQDTTRSDKPISFTAELNVMADTLASQQRQTMRSPVMVVTTEQHLLKIGDMYITREAQRWILDKASCIPIQQYYLDKFGWTKATFLGIDWDLQQRVLSSYDINDQRRILKFVHGWLPMNYRLHREKQSSTMRCPLCFYLEETELHLFQC
jgi:hypothetical protein